ncbi:MAG: DNA topoisomerase III [Candidatus Aminicenantes bacterium]|nr:DNA topoisomerase III [Candidatus Aminicenantes bacterium]NIM80481.1 DNA topoisomerase III [Candidatus Aminicenantes bacterium]NIN23921.1 DNA topoisomerase III [Candidatus Aminicenantes bacterium]NIN47636.1 DNA topoisomerase III [Candidatus Aminicenantes bacterium]NIN90566.1 DNA topoisomerase III [Candidatus Aminicenantes bacterium]
MKSIVLAEKPSVAREMARVLRCNKKGKGYFEGNKHVITWALGHLVTLAEPHHYDNRYREWRMQDLPMLPEKMKLKVIRQSAHQFRVVSNLMKRNDLGELIIATDAGREGELVARWIMILAGWKKPFKRLWISSQTDAAVAQGFANLKPGRTYDNLFQAAVCRAEADWIIGLNVTRALTCKFEAQLTAGRVQTPTLAMIIDREKEIKAFVPVDYWTVEIDFGDYFATWRDKGGSNRIFDQKKALAIQEKVKGQTGVIQDVRVVEKVEPPPLAYDLTELQRDANRRFGFSAKKTLSVLQNLYERHKLVTYPRTDSRYITTDMVGTLPQRLESMAVGPYAQLAKSLLQKKLSPGKRFVNDARVTDHHAIIPTEQPLDLKALDTDERRIYDLIARRFITVLYPSHRYDQTTIVTEVKGERFYAIGKVVKDRGWRAVTGAAGSDPGKENKDDDALPEQTLTQQKKGAQKTVKNCKIKKSKTQPPPRYTEATLLTAMESPGKFIEDEELRESIKQGGLGTPATRAEIIEKLLNTYYIERHGRELVPTSKGFQLTGLVPEELRSPELTAKWELRLANISQGKENRRKFMEDIRKNAAVLIDSIKADTSRYKHDNLTKTRCPMCNSFMLAVKAKEGKMLVCSDRKCGYQQAESQESAPHEFKRSKKEAHMNKRLIDRYSDHKKKTSVGTLGDLFEKALEKK